MAIPELKVTFRYDEEELKRAYTFHLVNTRQVNPRRVNVLTILLGLAFVAGGITAWLVESPIGSLTLSAFGILLVLYALLFKRYLLRGNLRLARARGMLEERSFVFAPGKVEFMSADGPVELSWVDMAENDEFLLLYLRKQVMVPLPKRAFNDDALLWIRAKHQARL